MKLTHHRINVLGVVRRRGRAMRPSSPMAPQLLLKLKTVMARRTIGEAQLELRMSQVLSPL
ncbi:hypothetical protein GCM10011410_24090 [Hoyosella rhizosphaerae]|uniref:Uncharacterized protein n=1 Tax=Hoyosella rhizosphaerae TaxID=1755582 RepID=A0A916XFX5_9ACTN|nr:hypothetical protein GCM10011410_24090 [Hoyosella rhizosphaerae]